MSRGPDAGTLFARALVAGAARAGCPIELLSAEWTRWASATFSGARHALRLGGPSGPALEKWLEELPEAEIVLRGHIVADLTIDGVQRNLDHTFANIEALTVEDR